MQHEYITVAETNYRSALKLHLQASRGKAEKKFKILFRAWPCTHEECYTVHRQNTLQIDKGHVLMDTMNGQLNISE